MYTVLHSQPWKYSVCTVVPTVDLPCIYRVPLDIFTIKPEIQLRRVCFPVLTRQGYGADVL